MQDSWFDRLIDALGFVAGLMLVALTALICLDVSARYFRLFATPWSLDIAEYLLLYITFLGAPWVLRDGGHIAVDIFVQTLKGRARQHCVLAANLIGAVTCLILLFYAIRTWWVSFSENILVHETFVFPEWYLFTVAPPVFLILCAIFVRAIARGETGADERSTEGF